MERPILFSTPMVRAILEGRKSQTRRIVKFKYLPEIGGEYNRKVMIFGKTGTQAMSCPYGRSGDILWVRETWRPKGHNFPIGYPFEYRATAEEDGVPIDEPWKPSIFMPKEACRIRLEITEVRVERLNDISEEDAIAEGVSSIGDGSIGNPIVLEDYLATGAKYLHSHNGMRFMAKDSYKTLWETINGKGSWDKNPWVWIIKFRRIDE